MARQRSLAVVLSLAVLGCGSPETAPPPAPPAAGSAPRTPPAPVADRDRSAAGEAIVVWRRWSEVAPPPGEVIRIDLGGIVGGPAGGGSSRLGRKVFPSRRRVHELASFARLYAPFRERGPLDVLQFRGAGRLPADAVVRRMVREWARLAAAEVESGASDEVYGVALLWQRSGPGATPCDELAVSLSGGAWGVACAGGQGAKSTAPHAAGRRFAAQLSADRMRQVYGWIDALAPLQEAGAAAEPEGRPARLVLAGAGTRAAGEADRLAIEAFAEALHAELSAAPPQAFSAPDPLPPAYPDRPPPRPSRRRPPTPPSAPTPAPTPPTAGTTRRAGRRAASGHRDPPDRDRAARPSERPPHHHPFRLK